MTILVEHNEGAESERIVGVAFWLLPNKRVALWHVRTMVKAGIIGMLRVWGLNGLLVGCCSYIRLIRCIYRFSYFASLQRCGFEWLDGTEQTMLKGFRKRGLGNPDTTWYLQQIAVIPECQGKGEQFILVNC